MRLRRQQSQIISKSAQLPVKCLGPVIQFASEINIRRQPGNQLAAQTVKLSQHNSGGSQ